MNIETVKNSISDMILNGNISKDVLDLLIRDDGTVIPLETILWDFKLKFDSSSNGYKKTLKSIVSLYNTHGGYIIYGIEEEIKDTKFNPVGIEPNQIDQQKLKGQFDKHFGRRIPLAYKEITLSIKGKDLLFGLLYIPKRNHQDRSLSPAIDASDEKNVRIFDKYAIYYRTEDECKQVVSTEDFIFISSPRNYGENTKKQPFSKFFFENNLPDKSFICPVFVGRFEILEQLWAWLADELQHSKVLAADGGKGKTSIAYEFCQLLLTSRVEGIEQIIWLTAKTKQFKAIFNEYIDTPDTHFNNIESLLTEICIRTGALEEEINDLSITQLVKLAKGNLNDYPSFIVIDDVDSNSPEEQKRILEVARAISSEKSKILLTTRVNSIYSMDSSISVPGMNGDEYRKLILTLCERFGLQVLNDKNIMKLEKASEGSPLFTESILRLFKQGSSIDTAIDEWSHKSGEAVREAALKKEVSELSLDAKKVLVTVCTVGSCSKTELHQLTDLEYSEIGNALQQLDLLFLLNSIPFIESEPRYEASSSISNLTISLVNDLIPEAKDFLIKIKKVAYGLQSNSKKYHPRVGEVVRQCNALIKINRHADAREALNGVLLDPEFKENKDLYYLSASIEHSDPLSEPKNVSHAFQVAYIKGQRKQQFFDLWYEHAMLHESKITILEICKHAITAGFNQPRWAERYLESTDQALISIINISKQIELLTSAYNVYVRSKNSRNYNFNKDLFRQKCQNILERLCSLLDRIEDQRNKAKLIIFALENGDVSSFTCNQLLQTSKTLRESSNIESELLDQIFSFIDNTIQLLSQQESPRTHLINALNEELIGHAKGLRTL